MKKAFLIALAVAVSSVFLVSPLLAADEAVPTILKVGDTTKNDIKAATLDGQSVSLKESIKSDYALFQFMTTACGACQAELTDLVKLEKKLNGKFNLVAIAMDMRGADAVNAYESKFNFGVTYLTDNMFSVPPMFGFDYTPSFIVVDKSGKILYAKGGYMASRMPKIIAKIEEIMQ